MGNFMKLSALCCLVAILNYHGSDAAFTDFTAPTVGGIVTAGVAGSGITWTAAFMLEDGATLSTTLTTVTATAGGNAEYDTSSTEFDVVSGTGAITFKTTHTVDYVAQSSYSLVITAIDSGAPTIIGTITITITVNAKPTFASPTMCWNIAADAAVGTTVGTYTGCGVESGQTVTTFAVDSTGNTNTDFSATMTTGKLVTAKTLAETSYMLTITAVDDGAAPSTGSIRVLVRIAANGATTEACCSSGTAGLLGTLLAVMAVLLAQFM